MAAPVLERRLTAEELLKLSEEGGYEVVNGELKEPGLGYHSGVTVASIMTEMGKHLTENSQGSISSHDTGLQIFPFIVENPDRVRRPDGMFFSLANTPPPGEWEGYCHTVPELVVEVVSPRDEAEEVEVKILEYLRAGVQIVWVAYPAARTIHVRRRGSTQVLGVDDELHGEDVIPGFRCPVARIFASLPAPAVRYSPRAPDHSPE